MKSVQETDNFMDTKSHPDLCGEEKGTAYNKMHIKWRGDFKVKVFST